MLIYLIYCDAFSNMNTGTMRTGCPSATRCTLTQKLHFKARLSSWWFQLPLSLSRCICNGEVSSYEPGTGVSFRCMLPFGSGISSVSAMVSSRSCALTTPDFRGTEDQLARVGVRISWHNRFKKILNIKMYKSYSQGEQEKNKEEQNLFSKITQVQGRRRLTIGNWVKRKVTYEE